MGGARSAAGGAASVADEQRDPPALSAWSVAPPSSQLALMLQQLLAVRWTLRGEVSGRGPVYRLPSPRRGYRDGALDADGADAAE
mmetsp:Transcript_2775/g.9792  ORF Transcript_2775/g.9792 Transcript_2775/m.9792 type:complete len:85 (+) Transcript_2775:3-257(+)